MLFRSDPEYRQVRGQLLLHGTPSGVQWTLSELQVEQGVELLSGEATGQADGKVVVKLGRAP